jgi:hypothetical protein
MTYSTPRVQHVHLETHGSIVWKGDDELWHGRTSSQSPFAVQRKLAYVMGVPARDLHVFILRPRADSDPAHALAVHDQWQSAANAGQFSVGGEG